MLKTGFYIAVYGNFQGLFVLLSRALFLHFGGEIAWNICVIFFFPWASPPADVWDSQESASHPCPRPHRSQPSDCREIRVTHCPPLQTSPHPHPHSWMVHPHHSQQVQTCPCTMKLRLSNFQCVHFAMTATRPISFALVLVLIVLGAVRGDGFDDVEGKSRPCWAPDALWVGWWLLGRESLADILRPWRSFRKTASTLSWKLGKTMWGGGGVKIKNSCSFKFSESISKFHKL